MNNDITFVMYPINNLYGKNLHNACFEIENITE